jgi:hypothetical protein
MAAINFPDSPTNGDTYTVGGRTWQYNNSVWSFAVTSGSPVFSGLSVDNIQIGITGANEIDTFSGNLTIDSSAGTVVIDDNLSVSGNVTFDDNIVILNNDVTGSPTENAGIEIERGTSTNVLLRWNETTDTWQFTNDGTNYTNIGTVLDVADSNLLIANNVFS